MPAHEIKLLPLIEIELESSFLVLARNMGIRTRVPTWGVLILGNPAGPILVDTAVAERDWIVIGSGLRGSKIALPGSVAAALPGVTVLSLAQPVSAAG